jgi:hypothetical protein
MVRMTTLKMSLLSALATLFLLVAMLASSGTASAHTASCQPPHCTPAPHHHPMLHVYSDTRITIDGLGCDQLTVQGIYFAPGPVTLEAYTVSQGGPQLTVTPSIVNAFKSPFYYGKFTFHGLIICPVPQGTSKGIEIDKVVPYAILVGENHDGGFYSNGVDVGGLYAAPA